MRLDKVVFLLLFNNFVTYGSFVANYSNEFIIPQASSTSKQVRIAESKEIAAAVTAITYTWSSYSLGLVRLFSKCSPVTTVYGPFRIGLCGMRMASMGFRTIYAVIISYQQTRVLYNELTKVETVSKTFGHLLDKLTESSFDVVDQSETEHGGNYQWIYRVKPKEELGEMFLMVIKGKSSYKLKTIRISVTLIPESPVFNKILCRYTSLAECQIFTSVEVTGKLWDYKEGPEIVTKYLPIHVDT